MTKQLKKHISPGVHYPNLVTHMAKISDAAFKLYQLTKPDALGKSLEITKQGMHYNIQKVRKEKKA